MQELLETILKNADESQRKEIEIDFAISKSYAAIKKWMNEFESENHVDLLILNTFYGLFGFFIQKIKK